MKGYFYIKNTKMVIKIEKNASLEDIRKALDKIKKKTKKGYPDLDKFSGVLQERDYMSIQKEMRNEWE
jgi:hypothetical protein